MSTTRLTSVVAPPTLTVVESSQRSEALVQPSTAPAPAGRPITPVDDAVGVVLSRAHDALRGVENTLELEAADPRVAELYRRAKALRKAIAVALVDVALDAAEVRYGR